MAKEEQLDIKKLIREGALQNELDYERALIAERKLRLLAKKNPQFILERKELRDIIETWEQKNWSANSVISDEKIKESDLAEEIASEEMRFLNRRKKIIKEKLKGYGLTQQELGVILGHNNKSYISELMNGIIPFSMRDLIYLHRILKIELKDLIPTFLSHNERIRIKYSLEKLNNPKVKLNKDDLALV